MACDRLKRRLQLDPHQGKVRLTVVIALLLLSIAGCDQLKKKANEERNGVSSNSQSGPSSADKQLSGLCKEYADRVCEVTGGTSPTCVSIKSIVGIVSPSVCRKGIEEIDYTENRYAKKRKVCTGMVEKICNEFGPDSRVCAIVREETGYRTPDDCRSMMKRYPEMVANLRRIEEVRKPLTPEKQKMIAGGTANRFGPENAKVTIVSFLDFQCPYSAEAVKLAQRIKDKYGDKARFVFRHFPRPANKNAHLAAQASLAAAAQGKFWQYQDLLFANQKKLARSDLERYARKLKLDMKTFKKALDDGTYKKAVDADIELGKSVYVSGTPTSYINGKAVTNPTYFPLFVKIIDEELK